MNSIRRPAAILHHAALVLLIYARGVIFDVEYEVTRKNASSARNCVSWDSLPHLALFESTDFFPNCREPFRFPIVRLHCFPEILHLHVCFTPFVIFPNNAELCVAKKKETIGSEGRVVVGSGREVQICHDVLLIGTVVAGLFAHHAA